MRFGRPLIAVSVFLLGGLAAWPQKADPQKADYDPRITFAPLALPDPVNAYRSSNGRPAQLTGRTKRTTRCTQASTQPRRSCTTTR